MGIGFARLSTRSVLIGFGSISVFGYFFSYYLLYENPGGITALAQALLPSGRDASGPTYFWLTYPSPFVRILEFFLGVLTARLHHADVLGSLREAYGDRATAALELASVLAVLCLVVNGILVARSGETHYWSVARANFGFAPFICLFILTTSQGASSIFGRLLSGRFALFSGEISYSLYLTQFFAFTAVGTLEAQWVSGDEGVLHHLLLISAFIAATYAISYCTYHTIEAPGRRLLRRVLTYTPDHRAGVDGVDGGARSQ